MKLGGSAITNKTVFETAKLPEVQSASLLIKACVEKGMKCIVVRGAGSFGHHQAKEFEVNKGWIHKGSEEKFRVKKGFAKTRLFSSQTKSSCN